MGLILTARQDRGTFIPSADVWEPGFRIGLLGEEVLTKVMGEPAANYCPHTAWSQTRGSISDQAKGAEIISV